MSWYHSIATFLNYALPQLRATRRTNLALLTAAILDRRTLAIPVLVRAWFIRLPYSHHQRKKSACGGFRFRSNARFDTMAVQTALLGPVCQAARLRRLTPIMIDWSDLGQGRSGLFAAVCFRLRGLPRLSWVSRPEELDPSQNRVEEFFLRRLLHHLPTTVRPLLLADRGFGRASLISLPAIHLWRTQPHRLPSGLRDPPARRRGGPDHRLSWSAARLSPAQRPFLVLAPSTLPIRRRGGDQLGALFGPRASGALVPGHVPDQSSARPTLWWRYGCTGAGCSRSGISRTASSASGWIGAQWPPPAGCKGCWWLCCWHAVC